MEIVGRIVSGSYFVGFIDILEIFFSYSLLINLHKAPLTLAPAVLDFWFTSASFVFSFLLLRREP